MNSSYYKMNKTGKRVFSNFLLIIVLLACFSSMPLYAFTSDISKIKFQRIVNIIREFTDAKEKLTDPFVQEAIFDKVGREMTLEPDEKPNKKSISEIASEVRKIVSKRFPLKVEDIKAKAEKEAKSIYQVKDKLDFVTVTVVRGGRSHKVSGIFYRYGVGGNSVVIGDNTPIAFIDLTDVDRAKFDKDFCARKRKEYVDQKIRLYYKKKQAYLNQCFSEAREKIAQSNIDMGYMYVWNKWRTPKEVTEYLIQQQIKHAAEQAAEEGTVEEDLPEVSDSEVAEPTEAAENDAPVSEVKDAPDLELARLKQRVEKKQMEIAGSQYGVDADQGFVKGDLVVLIGLTQDEVNLLTGLKSEGNTATLEYSKGSVDKVNFFFINHVLYKIEVVYRIGPPEAMKLIWDSIQDIYGESTEMIEQDKKDRPRQERLAAIKHLCPEGAHKWDSKGVCKKCGVKRADLTPPDFGSDIHLTWPGNIITAKLHIVLTDDKSEFKEFVLTKENPHIKEEQEEILKEERLRKLEEDKKRRLKEFKEDFQ